MKFVKKLLRIDAATLAQVAIRTRALGTGKASAPEQVKKARAFAWTLKGGAVPKDELLKYREKISTLGRAEADAWLVTRREAYQAEVERINAEIAALRDQGFESFAPNESQSIMLLLRWAVVNAPKEILLPSKETLDRLLPRTPSDPPGGKTTKKVPAGKTRRS
jgi:hypothetical protein